MKNLGDREGATFKRTTRIITIQEDLRKSFKRIGQCMYCNSEGWGGVKEKERKMNGEWGAKVRSGERTNLLSELSLEVQ